MPIYEYECQQCATEFEALVRSDTVPGCPNCHSTGLKKRLSVFATAASGAEAALAADSPCGGCSHMRGAGACGLN